CPGFCRRDPEPLLEHPETVEMILERTPMHRWGRPRDVALACLYLLSPASAFVTGVALPVDGGWLAKCAVSRTCGVPCDDHRHSPSSRYSSSFAARPVHSYGTARSATRGGSSTNLPGGDSRSRSTTTSTNSGKVTRGA